MLNGVSKTDTFISTQWLHRWSFHWSIETPFPYAILASLRRTMWSWRSSWTSNYLFNLPCFDRVESKQVSFLDRLFTSWSTNVLAISNDSPVRIVNLLSTQFHVVFTTRSNRIKELLCLFQSNLSSALQEHSALSLKRILPHSRFRLESSHLQTQLLSHQHATVCSSPFFRQCDF